MINQSKIIIYVLSIFFITNAEIVQWQNNVTYNVGDTVGYIENGFEAESLYTANVNVSQNTPPTSPNGTGEYFWKNISRSGYVPPAVGSDADINDLNVTGLAYFTGKVGVGTNTPRAKMVIEAETPNTWEEVQQVHNGSVGGILELYDNQANGSNSTYGGIAFASHPGMDYTIGKNTINEETSLQVRSQIGNVLVDIDKDANMEVKGDLKAKSLTTHEITVTSDNWADYVFKKDYELKSIPQVKEFIIKNGHLPGVPSEKDVKENGINLGQVQVKMLEKIEELTLYVIQLEEKIEKLKNTNN